MSVLPRIFGHFLKKIIMSPKIKLRSYILLSDFDDIYVILKMEHFLVKPLIKILFNPFLAEIYSILLQNYVASSF